MKPKTHRGLLLIDAFVNLLLGVLLLAFPLGVVRWLGLPPTNTFFYTTILGALIFGIGVALLIELYGRGNTRGLGLGGAIAINLCGGGALLIWLVAAPRDIPLRGTIVLWVVALLVLIIGLAEIGAIIGKHKE
jgi:hypothetical protein